MLTGTLYQAGYYMGGKLYSPRSANPKGFFEALQINAINEHLLRPYTPSQSKYLFFRIWRAGFPSERWLARLPVGTPIEATTRDSSRISKQTKRIPFAFKDPRFCYTLPAWRPYLPEETVFLCIFREPGRTANSMIREGRKQYPDIPLSLEDALGVWNDMYRHVLDIHRHTGTWLFLHYEQVLNGSAFAKIEQLLQVGVDRHFPDTSLKRTPDIAPPAEIAETYRDLCKLAGYPA